MILVDTSVWVQHFRAGDPVLANLLDQGQVLIHPFIVGEIAMGQLHPRGTILARLRALPCAVVAHHDDVSAFVERERLFGLGIGFIDAHLLAAARLTPEAGLWTRDRRLAGAAERLGIPVGPHLH